MTGARTMLSLMSILCLLLMAGCGDNATQCLNPVINSATNLSPLTATEAIKLAKQATKTLTSPPSALYITGPALGTGGDIAEWPDQPGSKVATCSNTGEYYCQSSAITYTTELARANQNPGQYVSFIIEWVRTYSSNGRHRWQFYVGEERKAQFLCEQGDPLPYRQH